MRAKAHPISFYPQGFIKDINTSPFHQLSRCLVSDDPQVKKPDVEVLGWRGYTWSGVVWLVVRTAKFSKTMLEAVYGRETNIQFSANSSGRHSSSQHANCKLPQNLRHLLHCVV